MANADNPSGFQPTPLSGHIVVREYQVNTSQTIAKGDAVISSSGKVSLAVSTSGTLLGVAVEPKTTGASVTNSDVIAVAVGCDANAFVGQTSGTFVIASHVLALADIEGTTGIMEVNEDATVESVIRIIGYDRSSEIGANTRVFFQIYRSSFNGLVAAI